MKVAQIKTEQQIVVEVPSYQITLTPREILILTRLLGKILPHDAAELVKSGPYSILPEESITFDEVNVKFLYSVYQELAQEINKTLRHKENRPLFSQPL